MYRLPRGLQTATGRQEVELSANAMECQTPLWHLSSIRGAFSMHVYNFLFAVFQDRSMNVWQSQM